MPSTREITAAMIRITSVMSWQASQRKTCRNNRTTPTKRKKMLTVKAIALINRVITVKSGKEACPKAPSFLARISVRPKSICPA
jgi:hypothetical protein